MTTYYKATFADGSVLTRSTAGRKYSHAWKFTTTGPSYNDETVQYIYNDDGFSGSEALARKAANNYRRTLVHNEVAPAVEITRAEYTAIQASAKARKLEGVS